jgi:uncharacterized phage protein (TIGR02218 family)
MRLFSDTLKSHIASDTTSLCYCWKLIRRDGLTLGFTDHDQNLNFQSFLFQAQTSVLSSPLEQVVGFAAPSSELNGTLNSALITDEDLQSGLYDQAIIETWVVNWQDLDQNFLLDMHVIGQITQKDFSYQAEIRSMSSLFDQDKGRIYQIDCPLQLGEKRCGVDLSSTDFHIKSEVVGLIDQLNVICAADMNLAYDFKLGTINFISGALAPASHVIRDHRADASGACLSFWEPLPIVPAIGDQVTITIGCDKSFSMCKLRFNNSNNYRGFPHIPGIDLLMSYANQNAVMDGRSLFR